MTTTFLTSREFNQDTSRAKRAAENGPVFITHRGRKSHVLLTVEAYERLSSQKGSIVEQLSMPEDDDIEFEPERLTGPLTKPIDLS